MANSVQVRTITELRENFAIEHVLAYLENGKLLVWLRDRNEHELADRLAGLNPTDAEYIKTIYKILDVPYDSQAEIEYKNMQVRIQKRDKLKLYGIDVDDDQVLEAIVFNQEELAVLVAAGVPTIYLCGDRFTIPLDKHGVRYIGLNNPVVQIDSDEVVDWMEKAIVLEKVRCDDKYQKILAASKLEKKEFVEKNPSNLNSLLTNIQKEKSEKLYDIVFDKLCDVNYDVDMKNNRLARIASEKLKTIDYDVDAGSKRLIAIVNKCDLLTVGKRYMESL